MYRMLTVAKLSPGQEAYYERSVAAGIDDYYAGRGESPGVWAGRAPELGLEGVVERAARATDRRRRSRDAACSSAASARRREITRRADRPGDRRAALEEKTLAPVAGYDLVFSPPKSVSLLHALGDDEVRHAVDQAHLAAWQAALALPRGARPASPVVGRTASIRERGAGFVAAAYQHRTSRAQDPHLHTHVIVANMAQSPPTVSGAPSTASRS